MKRNLNGNLDGNFDERFTDLSDRVSEACGRYPATAVAIAAFIVWIAAGPAMHWSDTWQLVANTPTTWIELFLGLLTLAAANRVQRTMLELLRAIKADVEREESEIQVIVEHESVNHEIADPAVVEPAIAHPVIAELPIADPVIAEHKGSGS